MSNAANIRNIRLEHDYKDMLKLQNKPYISWKATKGIAPYIEEYELTLKVRTYSAPGKTMNCCKVKVTLPPGYPGKAPDAVMVSKPLVFHPHWFSSGRYCPGGYRSSESLTQYVNRLVMTLQNDPSVVNPEGKSAANGTAMEWYQKNKHNKKLFPSDKQNLHQVSTSGGFSILSQKSGRR